MWRETAGASEAWMWGTEPAASVVGDGSRPSEAAAGDSKIGTQQQQQVGRVDLIRWARKSPWARPETAYIESSGDQLAAEPRIRRSPIPIAEKRQDRPVIVGLPDLRPGKGIDRVGAIGRHLDDQQPREARIIARPNLNPDLSIYRAVRARAEKAAVRQYEIERSRAGSWGEQRWNPCRCPCRHARRTMRQPFGIWWRVAENMGMPATRRKAPSGSAKH
jgi:hypothetical protein